LSAAFPPIELTSLQQIMARHLALYRRRAPYYQMVMLNDLRSVWVGKHARLLDIGGGTGVIAQAVAELFPVGSVHTIDLVDRFCPTLSVHKSVYDGASIPYADGQFNAATMNNVLHHVPVGSRTSLLREIRRVVNGPLYIKDHIRLGWLDGVRLAALDAAGNVPFGGMVWARYLSPTEWAGHASASGYQVGARAAGCYRRGAGALVFPNRLEIVMRFDPV
jgi:SAM-dependent methyltransferase